MTLRDEPRLRVENRPEGVTTVALKVEWLRRRLDEPQISDASEDEGNGRRWLSTSRAARQFSIQPETVAR